MKKLILGILIMIASPFIILLGSYILLNIKVSEGATIFACIIGGITIIVNYIIAVMLVITGHTEIKTFKEL